MLIIIISKTSISLKPPEGAKIHQWGSKTKDHYSNPRLSQAPQRHIKSALEGGVSEKASHEEKSKKLASKIYYLYLRYARGKIFVELALRVFY